MAAASSVRRVLRGPLAAVVALVVLSALAGSGSAAGPGNGGGKPGVFGTEAVAAAEVAAASVPSGFRDNVVFAGLTNPTSVRFASDGRIFVAEKSGLVKVFDSLTDTTASVVADLRVEVDDYWDRGLLGFALDPAFPGTPYLYLLYAYDAVPGGTAPRWNDACPTPPGPTTDGCVVTGKLVRVQLSGNTPVGAPQVLISNEWCQQFPSHSVGDLAFGPDGKLYVSGGDGASFTFVDYGQAGGSSGSPTPKNPCGDPPVAVGGTQSPPSAAGGSLRSQSIRRSSGPTLLNGAVLRLDPATGAAPADNPLAASTSANSRRTIAYGLRNPFRFAFRPGTSELWVGDVGWNNWEEIERRVAPTAAVQNFGWPCYEGTGIQTGYQSAGLTLCSSLYSTPGSVAAPYYTYSHSAAVVAGENCPTGNGSVVSGLSFYAGGTYPTAYDGALVFGDHSRNCIWAMLPGTDGLPSPANLQVLVSGAAHPVDIEPGPGGDLYYVDFDGGTIHSITYDAPSSCQSNTFAAQYFNDTTLTGTPVFERCEPTVNNVWGGGSPDPAVNTDGFSAVWSGAFDFQAGTHTFTATADDGIRVYVDGLALIDQWRDQSSTTYTAVKTMTAGTHQVKIEYYERVGDALAQVGWQLQSTGEISCPAQFRAQYFNNMTLAGTPAVDRCEARIDFDWATGSPDPSITPDHFSARWTGQFDFTAGTYTFSATADDGIRLYVDGAVLIDQWRDQSPTTYTAATTLAAGSHTVRVEYYENTVGAVAKVSWASSAANSAPAALIDAPLSSLKYAVGDAISFSGHATDPEQGALPASALSWTLLVNHCTTPTDCHLHSVQTWTAVASGTLSAPDHDYPSSLELRLTATDAGGLSSTASVQLDPKTVQLTFQSVPSGLSLSVGGASSATPFSRTVIVNSASSVSAPSPQSAGGTTYEFSSWSDGGGASHNVTAPATAATYTATYAQQAPPPPAAPSSTSAPVVSGVEKQGGDLSTSDGTWSGATPITFTYAWLRCQPNGANCSTVAGASGSTYTLTAADVGSRVRSRVTATNSVGSASAQSAVTATIKKSR